jgi:hypothetical protein
MSLMLLEVPPVFVKHLLSLQCMSRWISPLSANFLGITMVLDKRSLWMCVLLAGAVGPVAADELLVSGRVESITLTPAGAPGCPGLNAMRGPRLTFSNDCGCQEARIKVGQTYVGDGPGATLSVKSRLGEWCKPTLPVSAAAILVRPQGPETKWSPLEIKDGVQLFKPASFTYVGGYPMKAMPADDAGMAPLASLLDQLKQGRGPGPTVVWVKQGSYAVLGREVGSATELATLLHEQNISDVELRAEAEAGYEQIGAAIYGLARGGTRIETVSTAAQHHQD